MTRARAALWIGLILSAAFLIADCVAIYLEARMPAAEVAHV